MECGLRGTISPVGLATFFDPRMEGGKVNARTTEDLVSVIEVGGGAAVYRKVPIKVAFIRATTSDPEGDLTFECESLTQDTLAIATAAKNAGGFVIALLTRNIVGG